jgi:replicative DNA helicase
MAKSADKPLPYDKQAEIGVLGSVVLLANIIDDLEGILSPGDFLVDGNGIIYKHMLKVYREYGKFDPLLLADSLKASHEYELAGGHEYLGMITRSVPTAANWLYYAELVIENAKRRRLIELAARITEAAYAHGDIELITANAKQVLDGTTTKSVGFVSLADAYAELLADIRAPQAATGKGGIWWGLPLMDELIGPVMPGEIAIIAARPSKGKTALGVQVGINAAEKGRSVLFASLEMKSTQVALRELCGRSGVLMRDVRTRTIGTDAIAKMHAQAELSKAMRFYILGEPRTTASRIRAAARAAEARHGLDCVIVDYLGLIGRERGEGRLERHEHIAESMGRLKALAMELSVPVFCLCQLNRDAQEAEPTLANLRDSGAVEQDADFVVFIHHVPHPYLIVAKNRQGATGQIRVDWNGETTRFLHTDEPMQQPAPTQRKSKPYLGNADKPRPSFVMNHKPTPAPNREAAFDQYNTEEF